MIHSEVTKILGATDIYLIDQIMKGRFKTGDVLLDAGCGQGRNLHWFLRNGVNVYAVDKDPVWIAGLLQQNPALPPDRCKVCSVQEMPFDANFFDAVISSAVLHFAEDKGSFFKMLDEMFRVLKNNGVLFIRMASAIGIEEKVKPVGSDTFLLPDGSTRFLLTRDLLKQLLTRYTFSFLEDFKTVNVADARCMSTLVLRKEA